MSKTIIITGASDGIGAAAAKILRQKNHHVVIVGRSPAKTDAVARAIGAESFVADFTFLQDVRELAEQLVERYPRIDVLANNAGGFFDRATTVDGFDQTFQINHLAPFLLTQLLMERLIGSRAVIIQTSSVASRMGGKLNIEDIQHGRDFTPMLAYGTAKLDNILFTRELHRRYSDRGIAAVAFHPGVVATNFAAQTSNIVRHLYSSRLARMFMTTAEKSAEQLAWFAETRPGTDWVSGGYYEKYKLCPKTNPQAGDDSLAAGLWNQSEEMLRSL